MLHVYGRSVHPELFRIFAETDIAQDTYAATLRICDTGHTITFRYGEHTVTELTATRDQLLPQKGGSLRNRCAAAATNPCILTGGYGTA